MRMQDSQANCGSTALHNALAAMGIKRSPAECERLCGVTATAGVGPEGLLTAAKAIKGCHPEILEVFNPRHALGLLRDCLRSGRPAILCVDEGGHYVAAIGALGDRYQVADGAKNELVVSYTGPVLADRWGEPVLDPITASAQGSLAYWGLVL